MDKIPLTETQRKVYDFIVSYRSNHGLPPTRAEIAGEFGWASANAAECVLKALAQKGWVTLLGHKRSRGIVIGGNGRRGKSHMWDREEWMAAEARPNTLEG